MTLLGQPHHDGSRVYLDSGRGPDTSPELGDLVTLRVRTDPADEIDAIWIRTTYDAEPVFHPMLRHDDTEQDTTWWHGTLSVHNPVTHYRFLLVRERGGQQWLTGAGLVDHDVPDAYDFTVSRPRRRRRTGAATASSTRSSPTASPARRPPTSARPRHWAVPAGWDDEVVFEGTDPRTPLQLFGGDLDGITEHLDHVAEVGADIALHDPGLPRREQPPLQRLHLRPRSTRCSAATRPTPG